MKIAILGNDARAVALHRKLAAEGHEVRVLTNEGGAPVPWACMMDVDRLVGNVVDDPPDLAICLHVESSVAGVVDALRDASQGRFSVFGVTQQGARLEASRVCGLAAAEACGFRVPRSVLISNVGRHAWLPTELPSSSGWVVKRDGLAGGTGTSFALSEAELMRQVTAAPPGDLLVQKRIEGREFALALLQGVRTIPIDVNFEYKRQGEGDVGPNTPGMGTVLRRWPPEFEGALAGLPEYLAATGYTGPLDVSFMLDESTGTAYFLEFTTRFGDPESIAELTLMEDVGDLLDAVASRTEAEVRWKSRPWAAAVVVRGDGTSEAVYTGGGDDPAEACAEAYRRLSVTGTYRSDIGHDAQARFEAARRYAVRYPSNPANRMMRS